MEYTYKKCDDDILNIASLIFFIELNISHYYFFNTTLDTLDRMMTAQHIRLKISFQPCILQNFLYFL